MKNRLVVLLAGLCLGVLTACGSVDMQEAKQAPGPGGQVDAAMCPVCPLNTKSAMSVRNPVKDEVKGLVYCPPCGSCGDGYCDSASGETSTNCSVDCGGGGGGWCGDGYCDATLGESTANCTADCGTRCGDGVCNGSETSCGCSADCGSSCTTVYCGDGVCNGSETLYSCSQDCGGWCGDGYCSRDEQGWCTDDCGSCLRYPCPL